MEKISDERIIAFLEGGADKELEAALSKDKSLRQRTDELKEVLEAIADSSELDVPEHVRMRVDEAIYAEQAKSANRFGWMQVAAAVSILILGFGIGKYSGDSGSNELAGLRDELRALKEVTLASALQKYSASERIMAVNQIEQTGQNINPELIGTLINTLNSDDSPNVRYAALQALKTYIDNGDVRAELVKSLESQGDPLIQISLISVLVEAQERSAIAPLREIVEDEEITKEVRQQAEVAIQVLT